MKFCVFSLPTSSLAPFPLALRSFSCLGRGFIVRTSGFAAAQTEPVGEGHSNEGGECEVSVERQENAPQIGWDEESGCYNPRSRAIEEGRAREGREIAEGEKVPCACRD